jgi:4-alpha-glucanotransferase
MWPQPTSQLLCTAYISLTHTYINTVYTVFDSMVIMCKMQVIMSEHMTVVPSFMNERRAGILLPLPALPGCDYTGTYDDAPMVVTAMAPIGGVWMDLPAGPPDKHNCPYSANSAFAGDPRRIGVEQLAAAGDLTLADVNAYYTGVASGEPALAAPVKQALLLQAAETFENSASSQRRAEFVAWCAQQHWLQGYVSHISAERGSEAVEIPYVQWQFAQQAVQLKHTATQHDVLLVGDLPIYVGGSSADVQTHPEVFMLDDEGQPCMVAGVPPDAFSQDGQLWGNALYDWYGNKDGVYSWWGKRLAKGLGYTHAVRLDHARALSEYWGVPSNAASAKEGSWYPGPGDEFLDYLEGTFGRPLPVIAEDLGIITDDVRALLGRHALPGMMVAQFAAWEDGNRLASDPHNPANATAAKVLLTGTHDNPTTRQWYESLRFDQQAGICRIVGEDVTADTVAHKLAELTLSSAAGMAIIPIADVLNCGSEARYNTPGTVHPANWSWRVPNATILADGMNWLIETAVAKRRVGTAAVPAA